MWGSLLIIPAAEVSAGHCHITCRAPAEQVRSNLEAHLLSLSQGAARAAAKRSSPVGCHDQAAQPKYVCAGGICADRRRAARLQPRQQTAFCRRRGPAKRIINQAEQRNEIFPALPALNRQRALARRG